MADWTCPACAGANPAGTAFCGHCGARAPARAPADTPAAADLRSYVSTQLADRVLREGGIGDERRLVTALFADISGFTALADRLDPEELLEVIDPIVARLSSIVGRYDGYVEKYAGDALLALFGAPVAHEDDADRALAVALEMHAEVAAVRRELPADAARLTLHVGVNSGHGIARVLGSEVRLDYAVLGDAVILAQRLESAAPAGETYVGETTRRLVRGDFALEPVGELTLKGKAEAVTAWRLVGRGAARAATGGRLVARAGELAHARATLAEAEAGRGGVLTLLGDAGVGKSRLAAELRTAAGPDVVWAEARCLSYGSAFAYRPFADLLRGLAGIRADLSDEAADEALGEVLDAAGAPTARPFLAGLLGLPAGAAVAREPEAFRRGLHLALAEWLAAWSRRRPVVLALEDVHWADPSTLEAAAAIAARAPDLALVVLQTARGDGGGAAAGVEAAAGPGRVRRIELGPLPAEAVDALVREVLGGEPTPALARLVAERAGGNPFFAGELVRSLRDAGDLEPDGPRIGVRAAAAGTLPATVEGALAARIDRLSPPGARALGTASVIGRTIPVALLAEVGGGDAVAAAEGELVAAELLERAPERRDGRALGFRHALVQDVAYGRLLRRRRRELHLATADAGERLYGARDDAVDLLARHLYLAGAGERAVDALLRAGERARRLFANEEAVLHLGRAAEVARSTPAAAGRVGDILVALGEVHALTGRSEAALGHFREAREAGAGVGAWAGIAAALRRQGRYEEALATLDAAAAAVAAGADRRPLWLERGWTHSMLGRLRDARTALEQGLAEAAAADALTAQLLVELAKTEQACGRDREALAAGERALAVLEELGASPALARALRIVGAIREALGDGAGAAAALRRGLAIAERIGMPEEVGGCLVNLGLVEAGRGRLDAAVDCDRRAIAEFERIGHALGRSVGYANLAEHLLDLGEEAEAAAVCRRAIELARALDDILTLADALRTSARIHLAGRRPDEAARDAREAARLFAEADDRRAADEAERLAAAAAGAG